MQKPNNYDETTVGFTPINLGGHTAVVKRVKETISKTGKPMLQVAIDFDKADTQPEYFMKAFQEDDRPDKKWPYQATHYILTETAEGKCSRSFKSFVSCVERSNGSECVWGDAFEAWFTNKKVGVVFGEIEEEYNGEIKTRRRIRYFCSYDKALTEKVPEKKLLDTASSGFMTVKDGLADDIPF